MDSAAQPELIHTFLSQPLLDMDPAGALYVSLSDRWVEVLRIPESGRAERMTTVPVMTSSTVPLPDGRFLSGSRIASGFRVLVLAPGKDPVPFVQTDEDTRGPFTPVGADRVALLIGDRSIPEIAIVENPRSRYGHQQHRYVRA